MVCDEMLRKCLADGVIHVPQVLPLEWVARLAAATEVALASSSDEAEIYEGSCTAPVPYGELQAWKCVGAFREAALEGSLALLPARLMGSASARVYYDQLLVKEPGSVRRTPWHQDIPYWKVADDQICSIWLALDPIPGWAAPEFLRGSHTWEEHNPQHFMDASPYAGTGLAALPDIESDRAAYDIVAHDLASGDALIFHEAIVHGAPPADQSGRRFAWSTRWLSDGAAFADKPGERAFPADETGLIHGQAYAAPDYPLIHERA